MTVSKKIPARIVGQGKPIPEFQNFGEEVSHRDGGAMAVRMLRKTDPKLLRLKCLKCGVIKPLSDYPKRKDYKAGVAGICKECMRLRRQENTRKKAEKLFWEKLLPRYGYTQTFRTIDVAEFLGIQRDNTRRYITPLIRQGLLKEHGIRCNNWFTINQETVERTQPLNRS